MGSSPLAEMMAAYRAELAGADAPVRPRRRWRAAVAGVLVVLVLVAGLVVTLTRPGGSPSPGSGTPVAGPADPGPAAAPTNTAPPEGLLVEAPFAAWTPMNSPIVETWLPAGAQGPTDPPARGFARTPAGALLAAASLYPLAYYSYPAAAWTPIADSRVLWAEGQRESLEKGLERAWAGQYPAPLVITPVGYRPISYTEDRARLRLWWDLTYPDEVTVTIGAIVEVRWVDADWSLFFDEPGMDARPLEPTDTFTRWGPAT